MNSGVAYLLLLSIIVQLVLMTQVYLQAPGRAANRFFALYELDLTVASGALLGVSTTQTLASTRQIEKGVQELGNRAQSLNEIAEQYQPRVL